MNGFQFFVHDDPDAVRIELAGRLRGADVETVRQAWQREASRDPLRQVIVDITFITHADDSGRALLIVIHQSGARIVAQSRASSAISQPIVIQPIEPHARKPGWFHRLTMFLLEERPAGAALPAQAEIPDPAPAGIRHASVEYMGPRDLSMLEDALR